MTIFVVFSGAQSSLLSVQKDSFRLTEALLSPAERPPFGLSLSENRLIVFWMKEFGSVKKHSCFLTLVASFLKHLNNIESGFEQMKNRKEFL
ncbi:hypothetical protein C3V39_01900 [Prevotella sp. oral taxon 820]|nr:hypothetical protein C3V39_01900 [Prevotella sp. oral taxon 820]